MPSANVEIEASFVKESVIEDILTNPPTYDVIIPVVIVAIVSGEFLFWYRKRLFVH